MGIENMASHNVCKVILAIEAKKIVGIVNQPKPWLAKNNLLILLQCCTVGVKGRLNMHPCLPTAEQLSALRVS